MKLGVVVVVVVVELMGLFNVGVNQLPNLPECVDVGMHPLLDLGGTPSNVLQLTIHQTQENNTRRTGIIQK